MVIKEKNLNYAFQTETLGALLISYINSRELSCYRKSNGLSLDV